ncbi:BA75_03056T0 [Komagataella pastoris]|uniref:BA75_03056T0 n=1 Tax=Komagataella pastoris TaxID=4922 RepID=A0A1B2JAS6_PICPA|nr:BA75_03056T0 [Komagataella pastoris]
MYSLSNRILPSYAPRNVSKRIVLSCSKGLIRSNRFYSATTPVQTPRRGRYWKYYLGAFALGGLAASQLPLYSIYQLSATSLPEDGDSFEYAEYMTSLELELQDLPIVKALSNDPKYVKFRAWQNLEGNILENSLIGGTLNVPGGFAVMPVVFLNDSTKEMITVVHVGRKLCGYPLLVHGGILATILDENLKRCSILEFNKRKNLNLKYDDEMSYNMIHTKTLTITYKSPTLADNFIVIKSQCQPGGDKDSVNVKADIETVNQRVLVKGDAVFKIDK